MTLEIYPVGARLWVREIAPVDEIQEFTNRTGIAVVQLEEQAPRPTTGRVIAVGNDPLLREMVQVGDMVFYGRYAGEHIYIKGERLRVLELREITSVARGSEEDLKNLTGGQ